MEKVMEISAITAVTICSMGLALLIEVALLKFVFRCLAHVKEAAVNETTSAPGRHWVKRLMVRDLREAGL
jgi:hypothetical protein